MSSPDVVPHAGELLSGGIAVGVDGEHGESCLEGRFAKLENLVGRLDPSGEDDASDRNFTYGSERGCENDIGAVAGSDEQFPG